LSKKKSETKEGERNIRCAQLDESERVIGGGVREWLQYAGLQKRQVKGYEGAFVIIILKDKARDAKENNRSVFSNCPELFKGKKHAGC